MFELNINDKVVMLLFGMHHAQVLGQLNEQLAAGEVLEYEYLQTFIYAAHENHCKRHEVPAKITKGELFGWMEDRNYLPEQADIYKAIMSAYQESLPKAKPEKKS